MLCGCACGRRRDDTSSDGTSADFRPERWSSFHLTLTARAVIVARIAADNDPLGQPSPGALANPPNRSCLRPVSATRVRKWPLWYPVACIGPPLPRPCLRICCCCCSKRREWA
eukprot:TRINITY_DN14188_c0_g1_i1.p4 TRINITY_DN14188_c0_g1~~TRINITY_DN14188_c0_g1_i1.p4  ORF type:complete len:113 (-),score=5.11 TRINITY_DN14188_c0_g1_i1:308-646(-)